MPNGDDKNWTRLCLTIDGFRGRHGRWPTRVRICESCFADLAGHILKPEGFALVSSVVELILDSNLQYGMIAEADDGAQYCYGDSPEKELVDRPAGEFFGLAVLRADLDNGLRFVALWDAKGNPVNENAVKISKKSSGIRKKLGSKKRS